MSATDSSFRGFPGRRSLSTLSLDVRFAVRNLRRTPGLTAIIVATLALGIGATTAMFSVADAALFRPLPFRNADRLVVVPRFDVRLAGVSGRRFALDIVSARAMTGAFESVSAYATGELDLTGGLQPVRVRVAEVTPNLFATLGVVPRLGRAFVNEEENPDAPNVVVLSHGIWQRQFGGDDHIVGKRIQLNARDYEIIGVMPPRFAFPSASDLWIPYTVPLTRARTEIFKLLLETVGVAKLAPGVTLAQADAQVRSALTALGNRSNPRAQAERRTFLRPLRDFYSGDVRSRITIVSGLVALVVLMACINVSGLLIARSVARRREMAIRKAIGASAALLIRQLLTESLALAVVGAAGGVGVAGLVMRLFKTLAPPDLTALTPARLDGRVLIATLAIAAVTAIVFGVLPALVATRQSPAEALKSGSGAGISRGARRLSAIIVAAEVALAVVLSVGSGLMLKSLSRLFAVDLGINVERVVTARVSLPPVRYATTESKRQFFDAVSAALSRTPGIEAAAAVNFLPLDRERIPAFQTEARSRDSTFAVDGQKILSTPEYFSAMGIKVVAGRAFTEQDASAHVAVINESLAKRWPRGEAVGGFVEISGDTIPRTIIGVVNDISSTSLDGTRENQIYAPLEEQPYPQAVLVVRGSLAPQALFARIRGVVREIDPQQAVSDLQTMKQVASNSVAARRTASQLAVAFGAFAIVLAGIGIFGLLAFTVSERLPELGIRVALGAQSNDVIRLVLGDALRVSLAGAAVGGVVAFQFATVLRSLLFEVSPTDPLVFAAVPLVIVLVAIVAAFQPGRRAIAADPLTTMRAE
jgi:putative ABC transport system permease protein